MDQGIDKNVPSRRIFTIPNLLSLLRLLMIPAIIWLYIEMRAPLAAGLLLLLSGSTDIIDGFIARRFNMTSDLGKILDPAADKLTQAAVLLCLAFSFPLMAVPLALLIVRDLCMAGLCVAVIKRAGIVPQADWHGKAATALLYCTMLLHVFWPGLPEALSYALIAVCTAMIALSFALYMRRNLALIRRGDDK